MVLRHRTGNGTKRSRLLALAAGVAACASALPAQSGAQSRAEPLDVYLDASAQALMTRARAARARDIEGIESYEGKLRERIYVGLAAARFRRERGVFERERVARLRWSAEGERAIQWLGARQAVPIIGADTRRDEVRARGRVAEAGAEVRDDMRQELQHELLNEVELPTFAFDPGDDRLAFGGDWALHPLSDTAGHHYRFSSGDTLTIHLPPDRDVVLYEIRVEPRRADFHLVAGSLWFESGSGSLVRASYRPARAFNLLVDDPQDAEDVPGFLQPIEAEISYITVEYSLHELRFWLPRRFAMEGEGRLGRFARVPVTVEWTVTGYEVNEAASAIPVTGPLPPGWSRHEARVRDDDGRFSYVTVVVPETAALLDSEELTADFGQRAPTAFTDQEIGELRGELEALIPTDRRFQPRVAWGLAQGLTRFNRVEGFSSGLAVEVPVTPRASVAAMARIGTADERLRGSLALEVGRPERRWSATGYRRLVAMGDWHNPFSITGSIQALLVGSSTAHFYETTGASLGLGRTGHRVRIDVEGFWEKQDSVPLGTGFHLLDLIRDDTVSTVLAASPVSVGGVRGRLRWFSGIDPNGLILTGEMLGEVVGGDARYRRAALTTSVAHPLPFGLAGALEVGGGALWGDDPPQRHFVLGGSATLRGFQVGDAMGSSFWRGRAEVATGFVGARLAFFSDMGWAGPREDFTLDDPMVSVGAGASFLDGIVRLDLARAVRRGDAWRFHVYLDGLF